MTVEVIPMPRQIRDVPARWRPQPPPIFSGGTPSAADRRLALDLWRALDLESRRWYWRAGACEVLVLTARDVAALKRRPAKGAEE
jgi:hypothetical protein